MMNPNVVEIRRLTKIARSEPWNRELHNQLDRLKKQRPQKEPSECEKGTVDAVVCCIPRTVTGFNSPGKFAIVYGSIALGCLVSAGFIDVFCPKEDCNSDARDAMTPLVGIGVTAVVCGVFSTLKWTVNTIKEKCCTADNETVPASHLKSVVIDSGRGGSERIVAV